MKNLSYIIVFLLFVLNVNSQSNAIQRDTLSHLLINYSIFLNENNGITSDTLNQPYLKTIPTLNVDSLIFKSISSVPIFYNSNHIMDKTSAKKQITKTSLIKEYLGYNPFSKKIVQNARSYGFNFKEEWVFYKVPLGVSKKVIGYSPIYNDDLSTPKFIILDTLSTDKELELSNERMVLFNKVEYEYFPDSVFIIDSSIINNKAFSHEKQLSLFDLESIIKFISYHIIYEGYTSYDYNKNQPLDNEDAMKRLGSIYTREIDRSRPGIYAVIITVGPINYDIIKSIIYEEEWYIDPVTLRIRKRILSVSPVTYTYDENLKKTVRKVAFKFFLTN